MQSLLSVRCGKGELPDSPEKCPDGIPADKAIPNIKWEKKATGVKKRPLYSCCSQETKSAPTNPPDHPWNPAQFPNARERVTLHLSSLRLLLLRLRCFRRLFAVTPNHDHAQEASYNCAAEQEEDDGDANGPDAGREEGLNGVRVVDERHEKRPDGVVGEDGAGDDEHCEAYEAVELVGVVC